jgi:imidazolonepropionase-like amidohydrolase
VVSVGTPVVLELFSPIVEVRDANNALVSGAHSVLVRSEPADLLGGRLLTTLDGGRATFADIWPLAAGPMTLVFTVPAFSLVEQRSVTVQPPAPEEPSARGTFAIVGATVVPMDTERQLANYVVVVENDRVSAVGPAGSVAIPPGATVINGTGKWLMPGLVDFHSHESAPGNWPPDFPGNALMYLANSVTSIVNMGDFQEGAMAARAREVRVGAYPGPTVYAGLFARTSAEGGSRNTIVDTPADAAALAERVRDTGYDFVKVYSQISAEAYAALATAAQAAGVTIAGHFPQAVGLATSIKNGQSLVVHASGVQASLIGALDPTRIPGAVTALKNAGTYVDPTLYAFSVLRDYGLDALEGRDPFGRIQTYLGAEFMDDRTRPIWRSMLQVRTDITARIDRTAHRAFLRQLTLAMQQGGVPLLLGSDNIGVPGIVPGYSIHGTIDEMRAAGLSAFDVLSSGTRTAGEYILRYLRPADRVGTIAVGARADLLLLDGDPFLAIGTLRTPAGVMADGRWYRGGALRASVRALVTGR